MNLYRGHWLLATSVVFGVIGIGLLIWYFRSLGGNPGSVLVFLIFVAACLCAIVSLTTAALSYAQWVPKWERDEKRTGHVLGDERKKK
jgi:uncharacterized membrane protein